MVGIQLQKARIAAGLTQEQLAARAKITREYLSELERDKKSPTLKVFLRLCDAVDVFPPKLLERAIRSTK